MEDFTEMDEIQRLENEVKKVKMGVEVRSDHEE